MKHFKILKATGLLILILRDVLACIDSLSEVKLHRITYSGTSVRKDHTVPCGCITICRKRDNCKAVTIKNLPTPARGISCLFFMNVNVTADQILADPGIYSVVKFVGCPPYITIDLPTTTTPEITTSTTATTTTTPETTTTTTLETTSTTPETTSSTTATTTTTPETTTTALETITTTAEITTTTSPPSSGLPTYFRTSSSLSGEFSHMTSECAAMGGTPAYIKTHDQWNAVSAQFATIGFWVPFGEENGNGNNRYFDGTMYWDTELNGAIPVERSVHYTTYECGQMRTGKFETRACTTTSSYVKPILCQK